MAIDTYCRRQGKKEAELPFEDFPRNASGQQEKTTAESNEAIECIERIPRKYADVLLLKYAYGCRVREIAEMFGYRRGMVMLYIFRGKGLLRKELKRGGIDIKI